MARREAQASQEDDRHPVRLVVADGEVGTVTMKWRDEARCLGVGTDEEFFPDKKDPKHMQKAKDMCNGIFEKGKALPCPVKDQCLQFALQNKEQWGVWGGLDPEERKNLVRRQKRAQLKIAA